MARLTAVCRSEDYEFDRRQLGLVVDDTLTMVIQFQETCEDCTCKNLCGVKQKELEWFVQRFTILTKDEMAVAMMVTSREIFQLLAQMVPCVGCRRSVERLFNQLVESGHPAVEPLVITPSGVLSVSHNYLFDPRAMFALFHVHGGKSSDVMESIPKSKKNKRCNLHSLDTHKTKPLGGWLEIWDVMSSECQDEVVLIDADSLLDTLETYLRKHRFCTECKAKVMRAYSILVGELDHTTEKGYCPALYEGLRYCPQERHIHLLCDTDFISNLIGRAEPELAGSRRDRHAKTLDIAQEEVLTCLGVHIHERLHKIGQKLRAEEQSWQILFCLGVDALKKSYELALEKKQGVSNLELMCEELLEEERAKEMRREQKRQKRKKKRAKQTPSDLETCIENIKADLTCKCEKVAANKSPKVSSFPHALREDPNSNTKVASAQSCGYVRGRVLGKGVGLLLSGGSDAGYSSGAEGYDSCSMPSSNDSSEVACSDGICNHDQDDGEDSSCSRESLTSVCKDCTADCGRAATARPPFRTGKLQRGDVPSPAVWNGPALSPGMPGGCYGGVPPDPHCMTLSLQDMLERSCSSEDDDFISEEDIQTFKANQKQVLQQRQELRETLRQRFDSMQQRITASQPLGAHRMDLDQLAERLLNL